MLQFVRKHAATAVVAALVVGLTAGAPAIAALVNADRLDGREGVGCGATREKRAGAYVATCATGPRAGFLPNNIIRKAPNANNLDGIDSPDFARDTEVLDIVRASDGAGSGIDADTIDGRDATDLDTDAKGKSEDPADRGLTADFQEVIDLSIGEGNQLQLSHPSLIMGTASLNFYTFSGSSISEVQCRMTITPAGGSPEVISQVAQVKFPATSAWDAQIHVTGSVFKDPGTYDLGVECKQTVGDLRYARGDLIGWAI